MIPSINLLPWREQKKQKKKIQLIALFVFLLTLLLTAQLLLVSHLNRVEKKGRAVLDNATQNRLTLHETRTRQKQQSEEILRLSHLLGHQEESEKKRTIAPSVLLLLPTVVPEQVVLSGLEIESSSVQIRGNSPDIQKIARLAEQIRENRNTRQFEMGPIIRDESQGEGHKFTLSFIYIVKSASPNPEEQ